MLKEAEATTTVSGVSTRLALPLDTSDLAPGSYTFSVLEPDLPDWLAYPVTLR